MVLTFFFESLFSGEVLVVISKEEWRGRQQGETLFGKAYCCTGRLWLKPTLWSTPQLDDSTTRQKEARENKPSRPPIVDRDR